MRSSAHESEHTVREHAAGSRLCRLRLEQSDRNLVVEREAQRLRSRGPIRHRLAVSDGLQRDAKTVVAALQRYREHFDAADCGGVVDYGVIVQRLHGETHHGLLRLDARVPHKIAVAGEQVVQINSHRGEPDGRFVGRAWREIFVLGLFGDVVEIDPDGAVALKLVGRLGGDAERRHFARFGRGCDVLVDQAGEGLGDQRYIEQHTTFAPIRSGVKRAGRSKRLAWTGVQ